MTDKPFAQDNPEESLLLTEADKSHIKAFTFNIIRSLLSADVVDNAVQQIYEELEAQLAKVQKARQDPDRREKAIKDILSFLACPSVEDPLCQSRVITPKSCVICQTNQILALLEEE